ncbi:hypothetical protein [Solirubrum puertoriconensis]|uniref:DUF3048 domain-containing protein n=1 Tax=Solirubrum puertoriconensis TaxID=1751427 RepID=A0A9X0L6B7_SOLP1|nr:hypothetical protein [Solirubrum puertoriconensis]KUG09684.1 hypothetical protein ASU33_18530 [Solirubrum puertoriconensis]
MQKIVALGALAALLLLPGSAPRSARQTEPAKLMVVPSAFPLEFDKVITQAGGSYDVVLLAVRSRMPFSTKDGGPPAQREVYYAEAVCRNNSTANLKILFHGVPLRTEPHPRYGAGQYWRTQTTAWAQAAATSSPDGPLWSTEGNNAVAKYQTEPLRTVYPYPHPYEFQAPEVDQSLYNDERQQVYQYSLKQDVPMLARPKPLATGLLRTATPNEGVFFLVAPKAKQTLTLPAQIARTDDSFRQTAPAGAVIYAGSGSPVAREVFGVFRAYSWRSEQVRHHLPGKPPQRWLFITADEVADQITAP